MSVPVFISALREHKILHKFWKCDVVTTRQTFIWWIWPETGYHISTNKTPVCRVGREYFVHISRQQSFKWFPNKHKLTGMLKNMMYFIKRHMLGRLISFIGMYTFDTKRIRHIFPANQYLEDSFPESTPDFLDGAIYQFVLIVHQQMFFDRRFRVLYYIVLV